MGCRYLRDQDDASLTVGEVNSQLDALGVAESREDKAHVLRILLDRMSPRQVRERIAISRAAPPGCRSRRQVIAGTAESKFFQHRVSVRRASSSLS